MGNFIYSGSCLEKKEDHRRSEAENLSGGLQTLSQATNSETNYSTRNQGEISPCRAAGDQAAGP